MKKLLPLLLSFLLLNPLTNLKAQDTQSGIDGKWVTSDFNEDYQFAHKRFPKKMDNYKDSSIIVAGFERNKNVIFINRSTDRGESWNSIYEETTASAQFEFYQVQHPSSAHIIAIGEKWVQDSVGNFEKTYFLMTSSDTANTWLVNDSIFGVDDIPLSFNFKGKYGMIRLITPDSTFLLYSENYGGSWQQYGLPADVINGYGRIMGKDSIILIDQFTNKKMGYTNNIKTGSWQYASLPDTFNSMGTYIRNKDTIWSAVAVPSGIGNLQRSFITGTTDGGQNWNTALNVFEDSIWARLGLNNIDFATKYHGAALGTEVSYLTEDGGKTWENRGFADTVIFSGSQVMFYYYNPDSKKRLLMTLLNSQYIMKYEFEETTSLAERENIESQLKVYPNPAKNTLFVEWPKSLAIKNGTVTVLTVGGKEVNTISLGNSSNGGFEIPIRELPQGAYILQLKSSDFVGSKLFVKD